MTSNLIHKIRIGLVNTSSYLINTTSYLNGYRSDDVALPKFFLIGTQKAGTSSLCNYLIRHPQIVRGKKKEIQFFNLKYNRGKRYYKRQFPISSKYYLDATPAYIYGEQVPSRIAAMLGKQVKLIVSFRDPIDRCYSAWNMYKDKGKKKKYIQRFRHIERKHKQYRFFSTLYQESFPDFATYVQKELEWIENNDQQILEPSFIRRGFYVEQLQNWFKYFPREQFFFINSDHLKVRETAKKILEELETFLEIQVGGIQLEQYRHYNVRTYPKNQLSPSLKQQLKELYHLKNKGLEELTGLHFTWNS